MPFKGLLGQSLERWIRAPGARSGFVARSGRDTIRAGMRGACYSFSVHLEASRREFLAAMGGAGLAGCSSNRAPSVRANRESPLDGPLPEANGLNLIVICCDTQRQDHLGFYGGTAAKTPHLDAFAEEAVVFEDSYAAALPTLPIRRQFFTGCGILHEKDGWWRPMRDDDVSLAQILGQAGYHTGLITDIYHYFKPGMNYHAGFDSFEFIRGQENDLWISGPFDAVDPGKHYPDHHESDRYRQEMGQYLLNTRTFKAEDDYFAAQVFRAASTWLERSSRQSPFFLWIDCFDPHEPWDPPPSYAKLYRDQWDYDRYLFGYPIDVASIRESDYPAIRALYAGEVTYTDRWVGHFLNKIRAMGLADDTVVVYCSDHGTHLGEFGCVQKTPSLLTSAITHLPLAVRHPESSLGGRRVEGFVGPKDYLPTMLSLLGLGGLPGIEGRDFWPLVDDPGDRLYKRLFSGYGSFGGVRDREWLYFQNWRGQDSGNGPALFNLEADPSEERNVLGENLSVAEELRGLVAEAMEVADMPAIGESDSAS